MIPEWLSFPNKFHSRLKFTLHSHDKIEQFNLRHSGLCGFRTRSEYSCTSHPRPTQFAIFLLEQSLFSVYMIPEWHFVPAQEFRSEWKPEWTHSGMTGTGAKSYELIQRNIWRWNELVLEWKSFQYHVNSSLDCLIHHLHCTCQGTWRDIKLK